MDRQEAADAIRAHIKHKYGTQVLAAHIWGLSTNYVSEVVRGKCGPNATMLASIGMVKIKSIAYEYI